MKLKIITIEGKSYAEVQDDKPVYVHEDGKEVAFDAATTVATISRLNGEAKTHREAKEAAETKLRAFEGIEDGEAARKALETVKNLKDGDLVTAGKVEEIKAAAKKAAEEQVAQAAKASGEQIQTLQGERDKLRDDLYGEKIGGAFSRSKFISDKVAIPADLLQAQFGQRFKVEDGKTVAYDAAGNKIYSRTKPGEIAEFDEALETIIDGYAHRDAILKGTGNAGGGAKPGNGQGGGPKTISRGEFEGLDPSSRAAKMKEGFTVTE
ncbi:hypothetical protein C5748_18355 [Phyllobacterium phragmitis]|uniref:DUF6651 domain-containing protein n=1 Tax=Phyllobacterium phragmitis TaxID=2670329 RepID=A0A2S9INQ1_9HYPH|nr:DUF6651 domain-containing protein [Phyllobacterium phragmitis]PRD42157.1 hypothetical protein C5748_18355 [Phyllobacterium phragmitis]